MARQTTEISVPYAIENDLHYTLLGAGFVVETAGGGMADYVKDGAMTGEELTALKAKLAEALFSKTLAFNVGEDDEDDED